MSSGPTDNKDQIILRVLLLISLSYAFTGCSNHPEPMPVQGTPIAIAWSSEVSNEMMDKNLLASIVDIACFQQYSPNELEKASLSDEAPIVHFLKVVSMTKDHEEDTVEVTSSVPIRYRDIQIRNYLDESKRKIYILVTKDETIYQVYIHGSEVIPAVASGWYSETEYYILGPDEYYFILSIPDQEIEYYGKALPCKE